MPYNASADLALCGGVSLELLSLLELCGCFVDGLNIVAIFVDIFAWLNGQSNRSERRAAAMNGETKPRLDSWNWMFVILTPIVLLLTIIVVVKWIAWSRA
jgi:nicotinamide riboside transporter PnuC